MSETRPAYLLVHKLAQFNDEWYEDHTLDLQGVNPAGLYDSLEEAETAARVLTVRAMRGASFDDLEVSEEADLALEEWLGDPGPFEPQLLKALSGFQSRQHPLPAWLSDAQLGELLDRTGLRLFHVIETLAPTAEVALAQSLLAQTPQRPEIDLSFEFEDDSGDDLDEPRQVIDESDDPAVQRLNRVTGLFGRRYVTDLLL